MDSNIFWWIKGIVGVVALAALQYGTRRMLSRAEKHNRQGWKAKVGKIFYLPLTLLIWILGIAYLIEMAGFAVRYLDAAQKTAIVGCITWIFYRWKREVELSFLGQPTKRVDSTTVHIVSKLATIATSVIAGLIILQIFGVNTAPLLAFGSIGAASIGFAGKDVIGNFCSGILLHITRPFIVGDKIFLPEKDLEGYIEEIGWFRTSIRDKEKRPVYLPNSFFSTMLVINISRMTHRLIKQQLKIGFEHINKISEVVEKMRTHLAASPGIDAHLPIHVYLKTFGDYACNIEIEAYSTVLDSASFYQFQHKILVELEAILQNMHVDLAIPVYRGSIPNHRTQL